MPGRWDHRDTDAGDEGRRGTDIVGGIALVFFVLFIASGHIWVGTPTPNLKVPDPMVVQIGHDTGPPSEPITDKTRNIEKLVFEYTNEERKNHNLRPLVWDDRLATIARDHSLDMAENNFFDHTNLAGEDPDDRAASRNYPLRKDLGNGYCVEGVAENLGTMPTGNVIDIGYVTGEDEDVAQALIASWMDSPGHRANILDPQLSHLGVGVAYRSEYIVTQDFW